jgi:hypothetical protein
MQARHAAHTETVTKLGQVLSPTQMQKLKLLMPHRHRFMRARMGMQGPMGMHGRMGMGKDHWGPPPPAPGQGQP